MQHSSKFLMISRKFQTLKYQKITVPDTDVQERYGESNFDFMGTFYYYCDLISCCSISGADRGQRTEACRCHILMCCCPHIWARSDRKQDSQIILPREGRRNINEANQAGFSEGFSWIFSFRERGKDKENLWWEDKTRREMRRKKKRWL